MLKKNHFELNTNAQFEGFCIDLLHELSNDLGLFLLLISLIFLLFVGFTYTIHVVRDNQYGNSINGTWNGMIGEIIHGVS